MATWDQSRIGGSSMPALRRTRRSPGQPSVEDAPQSGTAVGERRRRRALGVSDRVEAAADQRRAVRVGPGDGAEGLPLSARRLDIADPDLQVPLAGLAAADEGRTQGHHDRRGGGRRFGRRSPAAAGSRRP
jgi:hypothetical protein